METFEGQNLSGNGAKWSFGTVTQENFNIITANDFGGAGNIGGPPAGSYLGAKNGSPTTRVALDQPANYIGFWWSGGEAGDSIKVYSQGELVGEFNTADPAFEALLTDSNKCNGQCVGYNNSLGQYFTFVNLQAPAGVLFDEIELSSNYTLELDNFVVADTSRRFAETEEDLTAIIGREDTSIDYGLYGVFSGLNTACTSYASGSPSASMNVDSGGRGEGSIVPTADVSVESSQAGPDICVSLGGQAIAVTDSSDTDAATGLSVALAVRLAEYLRFGVGVSSELSSQEPGGYSYDQTIPMLSGFVEIGSTDGHGFKLRSAIAVRSGDLEYEREDVASGSGALRSWGGSADLSYSFALGSDVSLAPFVGVKYFNSNREAYSDTAGSSSVNYSEVDSDATFLQGGLSLLGHFSDMVSYSATAGVRGQVSGEMDDFVGYEYGLEFRTPSTRTSETQLFGSVNATLDVWENSAIGLGFHANQTLSEDDIGIASNLVYIIRF